MLNITNINKLVGTTFGKWEVVDAYECGHMSYLKAPHFCITFKRGAFAGAVLIDRTKNRLLKQYHIYVCYDNYDTVILETSWSMDAMWEKEEFFDMVTKNLDYEWNKRNIRS